MKFEFHLLIYVILINITYTANLRRKMTNCAQISEEVLGEILGPAYNARYMSIASPPEIIDNSQLPGIKRAPSTIPEFYVDDTFSREFGDVPAWKTSHISQEKSLTKRQIHDDQKDQQIQKVTFIMKKRSLNENDSRIFSDKSESVKNDKNYEQNDYFLDFGENSENLNEKNVLVKKDHGGKKFMTEQSESQIPHYIDKRSVKAMRQWECESRIRWLDLGPDYFPRYLRSVECVSQSCWYDIFRCKPRSFTVKLLRRKRGRCVPVDNTNRIGNSGLPQDLRELWVWEERAVNFCCDCALQ